MQKMAKCLIFHLNITNAFMHYQELQVMILSYKKISPSTLRKISSCSSHFFPCKILSKECILKKSILIFSGTVTKIMQQVIKYRPLLGMWSFMFSSFFCFRTAQSIVFYSCTAMTACRYFELYWPHDSTLPFEVPQFITQQTKQTGKNFFQEGKKRSMASKCSDWSAHLYGRGEDLFMHFCYTRDFSIVCNSSRVPVCFFLMSKMRFLQPDQ